MNFDEEAIDYDTMIETLKNAPSMFECALTTVLIIPADAQPNTLLLR